MRDTTIARNYAEALLALANKAGDPEGWGAMISDVSAAVQHEQALHNFLETPRISTTEKNEVLSRAFQDRMPRLFVRFLQWLVKNRRQMLIPHVATEYHALLDEAKGRVHATVTVAREIDDDTRKMIGEQLSRVFGKEVIPHIGVNPALLGGVVVRVGDTVMDGSVRRRLASLRSRLI